MASRPLLVLAAAFLLAPATSAFHSDYSGLPLLDAGTGAGWVSYKVATDGSMLYVENLYAGSGPALAGTILFDEDHWRVVAWTSTSSPEPQIVSVRAAGSTVLNVRTEPVGAGGGGIAFIVNDPEFGEPFVGTLKFLLWSAGEAEFAHAVRGGSGTVIEGREAGEGSFRADSLDFKGLADADAKVLPGKQARAHVGAAITIDVEREMFAFFDAFAIHPQAEVLRVTTPQGTQLCPCWFTEMQHGPGNYTFHADGVGAELIFGDLLLTGADARLPT